MRIDEYDYHLPEELIAQTPLERRSASRLLVLDPNTGEMMHRTFKDIIHYINPGDCLVLNDSKVVPVRLHGYKSDTHAKIEILLLHEKTNDEWEALVKPARKVKLGTEIVFGDGKLKATCTLEKEAGARLLKLHYDGILFEILDEIGEMPLPPYIKANLEDSERYQTVYAKEKGSAAAPTAGLHFTEELLQSLQSMGVNIVYTTLHVGLGTFRPVTAEHIEDHEMHAEYYYLSEENASILEKVRENNGKIIAVGTTSTRVLETIAQKYDGKLQADSGWTNIFIYPPYEYRAIDGLITNFHLPKSTLLLLISALAGKENIFRAYEEAIAKQYRFFSFGDAMFILPKNRTS